MAKLFSSDRAHAGDGARHESAALLDPGAASAAALGVLRHAADHHLRHGQGEMNARHMSNTS